MRSAIFSLMLASTLVLGTLPFVAAGPGSPIHVDIEPGTPEVSGDPLDCLLGILFCYQCNDGLDNDADGHADYPDDPSCTSESDNDEYTCVESRVYAEITSVGSKYGTDVYVDASIIYSCPGGARFADPSLNCDPISSVGWKVTACTPTTAAKTTSGQGTYTCPTGAACTGAISPHTLRATIVILDNDGTYDCQFQSTTGVSVSYQCDTWW